MLIRSLKNAFYADVEQARLGRITNITFKMLTFTTYGQQVVGTQVNTQPIDKRSLQHTFRNVVGKLHLRQIHTIGFVHPEIRGTEIICSTCGSKSGISSHILGSLCPAVTHHFRVLAVAMNPIVRIVLHAVTTKVAVGHGKQSEIPVFGGEVNAQTRWRIPAAQKHLVVVVDDAITVLILVTNVTRFNLRKSLLGRRINFFLTVEETQALQAPQTIYMMTNTRLVIVSKILITLCCFHI